ncbi:hypothetical protein [Actinomadura geliboluensis]|uniref:hypothetical protein n=1 Tax=Actinomadura geliboluensis TaxID=882440 RepID=UPI00110A1E64|nr:hypothetical protein [Actinomadura geliboluensis]
MQAIKNIRTVAERADSHAIERSLTQPSVTSHIDDDTLDFLRRAHDLLLITTRMLIGMLAPPHRPPTIDIAEAWRRAHLYLPRRNDGLVLLHMRELEEAYQAIPILVAIPEPPPVPTLETETTLVIDKTTGAVTRWPLLPPDVLTRQYHRYKRQAPMTFDEDSP